MSSKITNCFDSNLWGHGLIVKDMPECNFVIINLLWGCGRFFSPVLIQEVYVFDTDGNLFGPEVFDRVAGECPQGEEGDDGEDQYQDGQDG